MRPRVERQRLTPSITATFVALALCSATPGCSGDVALPTDPSALVETHRGVLRGTVVGQVQQPLDHVEIVVQFDDTSLPPPRAHTDGAGSFLLVLAEYNSTSPAADSARATVYAIAHDGHGDVRAIAHERTMIRFQPVALDPPVTSLHFALPIL